MFNFIKKLFFSVIFVLFFTFFFTCDSGFANFKIIEGDITIYNNGQTYSFGECEIGKSITKEFTIFSNGTKTLDIIIRNDFGNIFTLNETLIHCILEPNETSTFGVTFQPTNEGKIETFLSIDYNFSRGMSCGGDTFPFDEFHISGIGVSEMDEKNKENNNAYIRVSLYHLLFLEK